MGNLSSPNQVSIGISRAITSVTGNPMDSGVSNLRSNVAESIKNPIGTFNSAATTIADRLKAIAEVGPSRLFSDTNKEFLGKHFVNAQELATEGNNQNAINKQTQLAQTGDTVAPHPAQAADTATSINPTKDDRMTYDQMMRLDPNNKEAQAKLSEIKKGGVFVGNTYVQNGFLKMHDFTKLDKTEKFSVNGKDFNLDASQLKELNEKKELKLNEETTIKLDDIKDQLGKNTVFGKSQLSGAEFIKANALAGFIQKDATKMDEALATVKTAVAKNPGLQNLANDGHTLSFLLGNSLGKNGAIDPSKLEANVKDFDKSVTFKMLNDSNRISNDTSLNDVKKENRNTVANDFNSKEFAKYAGKEADSLNGTLAKLGVETNGKNQFAGAAYALGAKDFEKLGNAEFREQVKGLDGATVNIRLGVGNNNDQEGTYADSKRGLNEAMQSQFSQEKGFTKDGINQLSIVAHGKEGMNNALTQIQDFQKATGARINLDLGVYAHSTEDGKMYLGKNAESNISHQLGSQDAANLANQLKDITGNTGNAHVTLWGCNTKNTADAVFGAGKDLGIGKLDVTATTQLAENSSSKLNNSDTLSTFKLDATAKIMTDTVTTNGYGNDTYHQSHRSDNYNQFAKENGSDASIMAGQAQNQDKKADATQINDNSITPLNDNRDGNGSVNN